MAVERRNPLPPGRYSVFVLVSDEAAWDRWTHDNAEAVRVIARIPQDALDGGGQGLPIFSTTPTGAIIEERVGDAVLFEVTSPVTWQGPGLPDIEVRDLDAWRIEKTENPEAKYGEPAWMDEVKGLALLAFAVYLGSQLIGRKGP